MHLLVRDTRSLDEAAEPVDLGHAPADLLFFSFSDSDLSTAATAWQTLPEPRPGLRLASLTQLRHPMSVDLYVDRVVRHARAVILRLLGGLEYWRYGAEEIAAHCRAHTIPLAIIPGDGRDDAQLAALSTVAPADRTLLDTALRQGGLANMASALHHLSHLAGLAPRTHWTPAELPAFGDYALPTTTLAKTAPRACIVFYRSHLLAGDTAPIDALATALSQRGIAATALYVASLKDPAAARFTAARLRADNPAIVLNATFFSARESGASPLEAAGAPILQLLQPGSTQDAWHASTRGLSAADLAMQVVLPEADGRILAAPISFKAEDPAHSQSVMRNRPDADGIAMAADRAAGWVRLATTLRAQRRVAIILSDYPGAEGEGGQLGHAVGLDTFASLTALLYDLKDAGYDCDTPDAANLIHAQPRPILTAAEYDILFATLPQQTRARIEQAWGKNAGPIEASYIQAGKTTIAVQPGRGSPAGRKETYHDPDMPPCHAYAGFHLWLRHTAKTDAMVQLGAHGTLEWLPGKAAALSPACFPAALLGGLPVIYPFIVNNPGEAAAARRRLGAVTIGHLTPPLVAAGSHGAAIGLESLIDEYAAADGMDRRRARLLRAEILDRAADAGLLAESGVAPGVGEDEALARLDAYLCDVKDRLIRDGLHIFGRPPGRRDALLAALPAASAEALDACAPTEAAALLAALDGRFIPPGPAGAPSRGRADVLPTGRNLATLDPRAVPTRTALALAHRAAGELLRRHLQDHGDWPRSLVIDLWGSAALRTGGEDIALALVLMGAAPVWDDASARVTGVEILPLALLDRPRVDVTLRISGLFRDAFPAQIALLDSAITAIAAKDEAPDFNPLAAAAAGPHGAARIFGPAPGAYGAGDAARILAGDTTAYVQASSTAYGQGMDGTAAPEAFAARLATADALLHGQDHAETDVLDGNERALHAGGMAAAAAALGAHPALYHADTSRPDAPRIHAMTEEIARATRSRAANPRWIAGMMRHGYRGAAEIARGLDGLHGFAATLPARFDQQFELLFDATLGNPAVDAFLLRENPQARAAMRARFTVALSRDLWRPRRNAVPSLLTEDAS